MYQSEGQRLLVASEASMTPKVVAGMAAVAAGACVATLAVTSSVSSNLYAAPVAPAVGQATTTVAPVYQTSKVARSAATRPSVAAAAAPVTTETEEMMPVFVGGQPSGSWAPMALLAAIPVAVGGAIAAFRGSSKKAPLAPIDISVAPQAQWAMMAAGENEVARQYATALVEMGQEGNNLDQIHTDMQNFGSLLEDESFADFFTNPLMKSEDLKATIESLCADTNMADTTKQFVMLLVDKRRIKHLANIVQEFDTIYYDVTGTQVATVTAASALSEEQLRMIANKLHTITGGHNVKIKSEVNEDLLAGFIVEYGKSGSQCLDLSLRGQLQQMEQSLNASVRELIDKSRGVPVAVQMMVASLGVHAFIADHADAAPGKLFDFDATMPIQMVQFLMLMVFLEKTVFTPIGKIFAERASEIKANRAMGAENNAEIAELNAKAEELLAAARKDANDAVEAAKKEATEKANSTVAAAKASSDQALVTSLADIQKAKEELWAKLEKEVVPVLADDIIAKCAPECVTTAASK